MNFLNNENIINNNNNKSFSIYEGTSQSIHDANR